MSTTSLTAGEVMDRSAALLNDPDKTDYTYTVQLPYLNMAIDELAENLQESNSSPTNQTYTNIILPVGKNKITPVEHAETPHYPIDLIEIQEVAERLALFTTGGTLPAPMSTGATSGAPGTWIPSGSTPPPNFSYMNVIQPNPDTIWPVGSYVVLDDASEAAWSGSMWIVGRITPVETGMATGATAGFPGVWTPPGFTPPPNFSYMNSIQPTPTSVWPLNSYVTLGDGSKAAWSGAVWRVGVGQPALFAIEPKVVTTTIIPSNDPFIPLTRVDFISSFPASNSFLLWSWENQIITLNPNGALTSREIRLRYVNQGVVSAANHSQVIGTINARSYLSYKTAALCAMFIGENESRAQVLETQAEKAIERLTGIANKGRQQIMTRHRPFRASYKMRGY